MFRAQAFGFSSKHSDQKRSAEISRTTTCNKLSSFLVTASEFPKSGFTTFHSSPKFSHFSRRIYKQGTETLSTARTSSVRPATQTVLRLFLKIWALFTMCNKRGSYLIVFPFFGCLSGFSGTNIWMALGLYTLPWPSFDTGGRHSLRYATTTLIISFH